MQTILEERDFRAHVVDFPNLQPALVIRDGDFYDIYINARLSAGEQRKALAHELEHLGRRDFEAASLEEADCYRTAPDPAPACPAPSTPRPARAACHRELFELWRALGGRACHPPARVRGSQLDIWKE